MRLLRPLATLTGRTLTVHVADRAGNVTRIERVFSFRQPYSLATIHRPSLERDMLRMRALALAFVFAVTALLPAGESPPRVKLKDGDHIIFFGDSLTQLAGAEEPKAHVKKGYVRIVAETLAERHKDKKIKVDWVATGGHTVPDLLKRVDRDVIAKKPTIVVIQIGCNDARRLPKETFQKGLDELIDRLQEARIQVVQCSLTTVSERHDGKDKFDPQLEAFAQVARDLAKAKNVPLIDLRKAFMDYSRKHNPDNRPSGFLTYDGNHFNQTGMEFVAEQMLKALK
jgi:lysophospholipase L1-like esterase